MLTGPSSFMFWYSSSWERFELSSTRQPALELRIQSVSPAFVSMAQHRADTAKVIGDLMAREATKIDGDWKLH
jgi:hypothetical protein